MSSSGDITEVKIIHEVVGSRIFQVKGGEDVTFDLGGYTGERMVTGIGGGHKSLVAKAWMVENAVLETVPGDGGVEFLQDISNSTLDATIEISHINGTVYKGKGSIEGDIKQGNKEGFTTVTFSGNQKLEKIA